MEEKYEKKVENGVQPLDGIMNEYELSNNDIVQASTEQLSHKIVNKARKGRRISIKLQVKITTALNIALDGDATFKRVQIFTYR